MKDKVRPLLEAAAKDYVSKDPAWPKRTRAVRQVELMLAYPSPLAGEGRRAETRGGVGGRCGDRTDRASTPARPLIGAPTLPARGRDRSRMMTAAAQQPTASSATGRRHPRRQQHRGDLRPRHPGAEGRVARRAEGRHRGAARRQRRRQDHHAQGDLQPAALRARRSHQGLDRVRRRGSAGALAQRTGAARLHPGDGRPPLLRPSHHRGESAHRRVHAARRQRRDQGRHGARLRAISRA